MRLPIRSFATLLLAVGVATCSDSPRAAIKTAPEGRAGVGRFSLAPRFSAQAAAVFAQRATFAAVSFDHVRIVLTRPPNEVVLDTIITFNPSSPPTTLDLFVDVKTSNEIFDGALQYTNNGAVVYQASGKVQSYPPDQPAPTPQELVAVYVGPGATATRVAITPKTTAITAPGSASFTATAFDANNQPVASAPIAWTVSDASIATLSATSGASTSITTTGKRGSVSVTALIPTNASDNATVTVTLPPAAIALVSGGGQTGKAGNALAAPAVVRVTASDGLGVQGVSVQFAAPSGGGVSPTSVATDAQGQASASLTLGGVVGPQSFAASAAGFSVSIPATATPGDPAALAVVSGSGQIDTVNRALRSPFVVKVSDRFGNGVGGVAVTWAKTSGGGTLSGTSSSTATDGTASIGYTLGATAGAETVTASVANLTPVTFTATAVTGPAAISIVSGNGQTGRVGQALAAPLVVKVVDVSGAPLSGAAVIWTATNGSVTGGGATDAQGQASATFTLGSAVGGATATATVGAGANAKSATFNATVQPGTVAKIAFKVGPSSVGVGGVIVPSVQVELQDAGGNRTNAVNAVTVALGANPGQATLGGTLTRNAVAGVATFDDLTLSSPGTGYTLVASSAGVANITSAPFNVSLSTSTTIALVDGTTFAPLPAQPPPSVTMTAGTAPANPPAIRVVDAQGAPIANATVSYSVIRNSATLFGGTPQTNAQGIITFATLAISPNNLQVAGTYSFVATLAGASGSPITLPVTVVPAAPSKYIVTATTTTPAASGTSTITAQLADQFDNPIAASGRTVSWTLGGSGGGSLNAASSQTNANGQATITYTAAASPNGQPVTVTATDITTSTITGQVTLTPQVAVQTPTALQFFVQPGTTSQNTAFSPAVQVRILDAQGAPVTTATNTVTIAIGTNPANGTLSGTLSVAAVNGVATFTSLSIDNVGTGYRLTAAATGLTSATSNAFDIVALSATKTWTGATSTSWTTASNWSGGVPGTADDAVIPAGTPNAPALPLTTVRSLTINPGAVVNINNVTFTTANGVTNQGQLNITQATIAGPFDNQGLVVAAGVASLTGTVTTTASSIFRAIGQATNGAATFAISNGFTNNGAIELTDVGAGYGATFQIVNGGTLVNAAGAVIAPQAGAGGSRIISAALDNRATINVANASGFTIVNSGTGTAVNSGTINVTGGQLTVAQSGTGSFANTGTISVAANQQFVITGGAANLVGGTVSGPGQLTTSGVTSFTFTTASVPLPLNLINTTVAGGTFSIPSGQQLNLVGGAFSAPMDIQGLLLVNGSVTVNGAVTTGTGSTIRLEGNPTFGAGALTVTNGFTNNGTIELTDVTAGYGASIGVTNGSLVNPATGTIALLQGAGGGRSILAQLDNRGTITIGNTQGLGLNRAGAAHVNSGTIAVTAGNFSVTQTGTAPSFTNTGSITLAASRSMTISGGNIDFSAGAVTGAGTLQTTGTTTIAFTTATVGTPVNLSSGTTVTGPTFTIPSGATLTLVGGAFNTSALVNNGLLFVRAGVTVTTPSFTTGTGSTIRIEGNPTYGGATLTVANGFTNSATIELTDITAGYGATLNATNGTFVNAAAGVLDIQQGAGGGRTIGGPIDNQGTITVANTQGLSINSTGASVNRGTIAVTSGNLQLSQTGTSPSFANTGSITLAANRTWTTNGGTLDLSAGTVSGAGTLQTTGTTTISFTTSTVTTPVNLSSGTTVSGSTFTIPSATTLTLVGGFFNTPIQNNGTLTVLGSVVINGITTGAGSNVIVQGNPTYGGANLTVTNGFTNTATIALTDVTAGYGATLGVTNGAFTNASTGTLDVQPGAGGGRTLAASLNNQGTITLGNSQGLSINKPSGVSTNSGTIAVTSGNLSVTQTGTTPSFTNTGTITVASGRTFTVAGGTLDLSAGTVSGAGTLQTTGTTAVTFTPTTVTTVINFSSGTTVSGTTFTIPTSTSLTIVGGFFNTPIQNDGTLNVRGTVTINGLSTGTGSTLHVEGTPTYGGGNLTVTNGFTNSETIELTDVSAGYGATIGVTNGSLTNTGTIDPQQGAGGPRTIAAQLINQGTIIIGNSQGLTLSKAGAAHVNSGSIQVSNGNFSLVLSGTNPSFTNAAGGNIGIGGSQTWFVNGGVGVLDLTNGSTAGGGIVNVNVATLAMAIPAVSAALTISSSTAINGGVITVPASRSLTLINSTVNGNLDVQSGASVFIGATVNVTGTVTNVASSLIRVIGNGALARLTVANGFTNNGRIDLTDVNAGYGARFSVTTGTLTNSSTGILDALAGAGGPRTIDANIDNQGTLAISSGSSTASTLTVNGNVTNSGTINLDITNGSGTSDRLSINGTATLGGTLNVTGVGSFTVTSNVPYTLLNYTSATGNFASYSLPAQAVNGWQTPTVGATTLTIRAN